MVPFSSALVGNFHSALDTTAMQLEALKKAGCKAIFKDDGISGATTKRPSLLRCLKKLEHGDVLIVWKLDRLGRSLRDLGVGDQWNGKPG